MISKYETMLPILPISPPRSYPEPPRFPPIVLLFLRGRTRVRSYDLIAA